MSSPVEIVDSIFLPVEVNNSTIELYLPVDSQYSSLVEALNLIVEPKPLAVEVNNSDHVYCRPSVGRYYRPIWRPTLGRYIDRHSVDMSAETRSSVGRHVVLVMSVDTRPTPRPVCCDRQSLVYRSTVGEVSVGCR